MKPNARLAQRAVGNWFTSFGSDCQHLTAYADGSKNDGKAESDSTYGSEIIMTFSLTKKQICLAVSCALALGVVAGVASAQSNLTNPGYLTDQASSSVVKSGFGLCWRAGSDPTPTSTAECDPNYVAPAVAKAAEPVAQPVVVAAAAPQPAPKPAAESVRLDADMLFDFDKAVLRPAGRAALDDFVVKTQDINPEVITAVGHADRFGSEAYNQRLSEQRVAAVKTYLVSKGIAADRVSTEGKGETQPITKAGECLGAKSAKTVACLQPDRRVDIEVMGTRSARLSSR